MLDLEKLAQLITFSKEGTLLRASEKLGISQPSLTRNMKLLEQELNVKLFNRRKNKLTLNEIGIYTVQRAEKLLASIDAFTRGIQHFALQTTTFFGGASALGIIWYLEEQNFAKKLNLEFIPNNDVLLKNLLNEQLQFISTDFPLQREGVISKEVFTEKLYLSVPESHPLAKKKSIYLKDLEGVTMLLRSKNLGPWQEIIEKLPKTKFILQENWKTFDELVLATELPNFTTNVSIRTIITNDRIHIPIEDKIATKNFYISVLEKNKNILDELTSE